MEQTEMYQLHLYLALEVMPEHLQIFQFTRQCMWWNVSPEVSVEVVASGSESVSVGRVPELATGGMPEVASSDVGIVTGELQHE